MSMPHPRSLAELDPALALPHRRKMEILFAVLLVIFLSALDQTIVGVALPRIVGELGGTNELYTWVITSYLLTATVTGVFYGKLSDIYGRRLMLLFGVTVFLIGSALSGLSWSMESLIVFRGIQGIGAGAIFPVSLAVIGDLFSPRERGRYQHYLTTAEIREELSGNLCRCTGYQSIVAGVERAVEIMKTETKADAS